MPISRKWKSLLTMLTVLASACQGGEGEAQAAGVSAPESVHKTWAKVLENYHHEGGLDYAGLAADPVELNAYLAELSFQTIDGWADDEVLAFWINAYNAVAVHHVIERYPEIKSVKDVDGIFDEITARIAGEDLTLDEIESRSRELGDARVHFAVVCASERWAYRLTI